MLPLAVGWREPVRPALTVGQRSLLRAAATARALSTLRAAMRRSRLLRSASWIKLGRRAPWKAWAQGRPGVAACGPCQSERPARRQATPPGRWCGGARRRAERAGRQQQGRQQEQSGRRIRRLLRGWGPLRGRLRRFRIGLVRVKAPLALAAREQAPRDNEEHRHQQHRQQRGRQHAAEHAGADGALAGRAGATGQHQGMTPSMKASEVIRMGLKRRCAASRTDSTRPWPRVQLLGELDDQHRVLGREADDGDHADLEVDVVLQAAKVSAQHDAEHAEWHHQQHRERDAPAFVQRREAQGRPTAARTRRGWWPWSPTASPRARCRSTRRQSRAAARRRCVPSRPWRRRCSRPGRLARDADGRVAVVADGLHRR